MQYNIHPIFVHFPIALLLLYSLIKIIPLRRWLPRVAWKDIQFFLLAAGVLGAFVALATGEIAEELTRPNHDLVEAHGLFASISIWIYGALFVGELLRVWNTVALSATVRWQRIQKVTVFLERLLSKSVFSIFLALIALGAILLTAMLGGIMVYGTTADPFAATILRLLGLTI